jgi:hypothetical protein
LAPLELKKPRLFAHVFLVENVSSMKTDYEIFKELSLIQKTSFLKKHPEYDKSYYVSYAFNRDGFMGFGSTTLSGTIPLLQYGPSKGHLAEYFEKELRKNYSHVVIVNFWEI